jgi:4-diphosphocytidyl-2-C-methyl-D-erythritol kinase
MNMVKSAGEIRDNAEYRQIIRIDGDTYTASALAKLNIKLSIGEREHGGLHRISSIFQTVSLRDHIILKKVRAGEEGIEGFVVRENIMAKALDELAIELGMESILCRINATKSIPVAAGMGGGSSDAAAVLRLANRAFGFGMSLEELDKVARRVGNDVSFLLRGGRAHVEEKSTR